MSDREFENYLALLSSLLRLDRKQRGTIADELRAHLEDRLEELLARGVSHDEAVRQALAEFGDAAGLAGQFGAISRNRKRRWLMRLTTFSVAATLLFAAGLAIFWPGRNAAPGISAAVAQAPTATETRDPFAAPPPAAEPSLQERLNSRIDLNVVEMPLKDVIAHLQKETGIQIVLNQMKLEEASVSPDTPITRSLKRVRVSTLLDVVLKELELTYVERDDVLMITTPEDATMEVRVYDCRDLLAMPTPDGGKISLPAVAASAATKVPGKEVTGAADPFGAPAREPQAPAKAGSVFGGSRKTEHQAKAEQLMEIVSNNVDPQTWNEVGGPGSIGEYNGLIVVTQTGHTHRKVERLFDMLREAAGLEVPKSGKVVR